VLAEGLGEVGGEDVVGGKGLCEVWLLGGHTTPVCTVRWRLVWYLGVSLLSPV
jgi:hypothetical protein